jgi:hypothetical protein
MTLAITECPICSHLFQAHAYQRGGIMRLHLKEVHPEAEAEIRAFEQEFMERRRVLREKYGKDFLFLTR